MKEETEVKKKSITIPVWVHEIQADIYTNLANGKINLTKDSLRGIAKKIGQKSSPQQIKHHLEQLVKLGVINKIHGQYSYENK